MTISTTTIDRERERLTRAVDKLERDVGDLGYAINVLTKKRNGMLPKLNKQKAALAALNRRGA